MSEKPEAEGRVRPARFQPPLPRDRLILQDAPDPEALPMDVVFVGAGPAGLAGAIELARLVRKDNESDGGLGEVEMEAQRLPYGGEVGIAAPIRDLLDTQANRCGAITTAER